jgi:hypothetical protein
MELSLLLERMKMEHLSAQLDGVCEQAAKGDLDYRAFSPRRWRPSGGAAISAAWKAASSSPASRG